MAQRHGDGAARLGRHRPGSRGRDAELARASRRTARSAWTRAGSTASIVVDAQGNIIEEWTQWDKIFKRPHSVYVNPYDAQKHVWVVDDHMHAIYKFTNDGKTLVQTIGTPTVPGADATHFNRPTFMAWDPDSNFYVADGYNGTRVAKFDANGKFVLDWGQKGEAGGNETRPGYWNNVHGIAVDPVRGASTSTTAATTASRSSTTTATTRPSGRSRCGRRACTCCTWAPTACCGPSIATRRSC